MSLQNFVPSLWAADILEALEKTHVYASPIVINRDYEGMIQEHGDTVRINSIGDPTISNYTRNTNMSAAETLVDAGQVLVIDQAKYFHFQIDDIDKAQQTPKVRTEAMQRAGYGLRDAADTYLAGLYAQAGLTSGLGDDTTELVPTAGTAGSTVYDYLVDMGVLLDEQNCPTQGRWVILPAWIYGLLLKDARFVSYGTEANRATLASSNVGRAANFEIMVSNNVPNTAGEKYKVLAGHPIAWTFAEQILKVDAYQPELRFGEAIKGLHVYGAKVLRSNCLCLATFSKT
jgi:hypothetical protein